jgi:hypothetical protein
MINPANTCDLIGHNWTFKGKKKICLRCGLVVTDDLDNRVNNLTEDTAADLQITHYLHRKQAETISKLLNSCVNIVPDKK